MPAKQLKLIPALPTFDIPDKYKDVPSFGASPHTPFGNILFCRFSFSHSANSASPVFEKYLSAFIFLKKTMNGKSKNGIFIKMLLQKENLTGMLAQTPQIIFLNSLSAKIHLL